MANCPKCGSDARYPGSIFMTCGSVDNTPTEDFEQSDECTINEQHNSIWEQRKEIERLREALRVLACLGNGDTWGNSDGNRIAQRALENK